MPESAPSRRSATLRGGVLLALLGALALAGPPLREHRPPRDHASLAAQAFLDTLRPELRERAQLPFDHAGRADWHFVPRARAGVPLREMNDRERAAAHRLLRAALSSAGYLKCTTIMELDQLLREAVEARAGRADHRDPTLYHFTIFGNPAGGGPWGWRVEGHHLSLNFSSADGETAVTPAFLGANPAEVREGRRAGLRALGAEEDLARRLLASLDEEQRATAVADEGVPRDILLAPGVAPGAIGPPRGLSLDAMRPAQRELVEALLAEWAGNLRADLGAAQLARIREAGPDGVHFLWIGGDSPGEPHYYRLHGPTFVIEYDNTQDGANHVHTVWRDPERDFGADLLRRHLHEAHGSD
ncbi:MAG TPA: DUF3500 domain-containing protein [Phycisphaerales bacterium]|nr:DUF3500 domain-containing protein [Phycisphaerales bacterium]